MSGIGRHSRPVAGTTARLHADDTGRQPGENEATASRRNVLRRMTFSSAAALLMAWMPLLTASVYHGAFAVIQNGTRVGAKLPCHQNGTAPSLPSIPRPNVISSGFGSDRWSRMWRVTARRTCSRPVLK
jgi:hypothetical protein